MSKWITDRKPTYKDAHKGSVWLCRESGYVDDVRWDCVILGEPWMPIETPEPYNEPKKCLVFPHEDGSGFYKIYVPGIGVCAYHLPTREAANRIAAIYEEVMA